MKKWLNYEFESSTVQTKEFRSFATAFKNALNKQLKDRDIKIVSYNVNHFYVSGFVEKDSKYIYFSISDVRHFNNDWYKSILYRTAKDIRDFTGGHNNYTSLETFGENVEKLFRRTYKRSEEEMTDAMIESQNERLWDLADAETVQGERQQDLIDSYRHEK